MDARTGQYYVYLETLAGGSGVRQRGGAPASPPPPLSSLLLFSSNLFFSSSSARAVKRTSGVVWLGGAVMCGEWGEESRGDLLL